jgi:hypothetical protein
MKVTWRTEKRKILFLVLIWRWIKPICFYGIFSTLQYLWIIPFGICKGFIPIPLHYNIPIAHQRVCMTFLSRQWLIQYVYGRHFAVLLVQCRAVISFLSTSLGKYTRASRLLVFLRNSFVVLSGINRRRLIHLTAFFSWQTLHTLQLLH